MMRTDSTAKMRRSSIQAVVVKQKGLAPPQESQKEKLIMPKAASAIENTGLYSNINVVPIPLPILLRLEIKPGW